MATATNELVILEETITSKIYNLRGKNIMLDRDLAELYGVKAIRLREQVKRNIVRFPNYFMFRLTRKKQKLWYRKMRYLLNSI